MSDPLPAGNTVWISLGSNLGNSLDTLRSACEYLADLPGTHVTRRSSWYESAPMGPQDQDDFINSVVELHTLLEPEALLDALQAIEQAHGRKRERRWGPRTLDIDILLYAERIISTDRLEVPHPGISERNFVLYPLLELEPELVIPGVGCIAELAPALGTEGLQRLEEA